MRPTEGNILVDVSKCVAVITIQISFHLNDLVKSGILLTACNWSEVQEPRGNARPLVGLCFGQIR